MAPTKNPKHRPLRKTPVAATPHPSVGQGFAYGIDFHQFAMYVYNNGHYNHPLITDAQQNQIFQSGQTLRRLNMRSNHLGYMRRFYRQGNWCATLLVGYLQFMLAFWRVIWPKSTHAELKRCMASAYMIQNRIF